MKLNNCLLVLLNVFAFFVFTTKSANTGVSCPAIDGEYPVYIPGPNCTQFYECSNGVPYLFDCPDGLEFNPKLNVCDWPGRAGCRGQNEAV